MTAEDPELTDEESEDDGEECLPPPPSAFRTRASVSAEAFGDWNKPVAFEPPVYPKSDEQIAELKAIVSQSFLFNTLDDSALQVLVLAMHGPLMLEPGFQLITEGDAGDHLYVIESGILDCWKVIDGTNVHVKTCVKGDLFGELALLYNCPRKASVVSREASCVWELARETFNFIVMEAVKAKRAQCSEVLHKVPMFATLSESEVENIIDALKQEKFQYGSTIITQGDEGHHFYIIYAGEVMASRDPCDGSEPITMFHKAGDYFGELSMLTGQARAASVVACSQEVQLLSMDRATFKRLMGPLEEFFQRGVARYE
jgi:cAMP-dependent protein kinase regulator|eukprot:TRINITY_DN69842_c0_g1_i1.p1 TRINITY_DN69842_c0_g1~~TRINITY_DN69842_c0_g1_i1.p1  ORF type:complete len:342 (-),score=84.46 TRINITY_DN69842_c0_g1_i1:54-998(-)